MEFKHVSVLLTETIDSLNIKPDGIYVDGTLGGGGHSLEIAKRLTTGKLIGIDRDDDALKAAAERLKEYEGRVIFKKGNYLTARTLLAEENIEKVDGILLDIGVSSYQIDNPDRGFTYIADGPLDMRMDQTQALSAKVVVNTYPKEELARIIRMYGEDKFANNIARHIVEYREAKEIETTEELSEIIKGAIPASVRKGDRGFAKRTFQALRIEVNGELDALEGAIPDMIDLLNPEGRLSIITFHSLEDRIVKNAFKKAEDPCTCPPQFPKCVCGAVSKGRVITKKPIAPGEEELKVNKRAASSKLRVFEKA
ncbi:MAG: 16S rRNA (cytosine(1402)-N(4))-methyltransferase RsmH [Parasporobacterium sp.]|nr:16S rRNA (cytosine(1402)-N(4))-methyltransferase RsmH [Parasporobacterium sp.]